MRRLVAVALCVACGEGGAGPADGAGGGRLASVVAPQDRDTVRFEARATARPCARRAGMLLVEGIARGNGVLLLLRDADSLTSGAYPLLARGDTVTPRGALVAVRYLIGNVARGVVLDSGAVTVALRDGRLAARVRGTGLEATGSLRAHVDARFEDVSPASAADTVACEVAV